MPRDRGSDNIMSGALATIGKHLQIVMAQNFWEFMPLVGFELLKLGRKGVNNQVANLIIAIIIKVSRTDKILKSNLFIKSVLAVLRVGRALIPVGVREDWREGELFDTLEEIAEEATIQQTAFKKENDLAVNLKIADDIVAEAFGKQKGDGSVTTTPTAPKPQAASGKLAFFEAVAELEPGDQSTVSGIIERLMGLAPVGTAVPPHTSIPGESHEVFLGELMAAQTTKAELRLVVKAPSPTLQEKALLLIVHRPHEAGKAESMAAEAKGFFAKLMPHLDSDGKALGELNKLVSELEATNRILGSVR